MSWTRKKKKNHTPNFYSYGRRCAWSFLGFDCADTLMTPLWPIGHTEAIWKRSRSCVGVLGILSFPHCCSATSMRAGMLFISMLISLQRVRPTVQSLKSQQHHGCLEFVFASGYESLRNVADQHVPLVFTTFGASCLSVSFWLFANWPWAATDAAKKKVSSKSDGGLFFKK